MWLATWKPGIWDSHAIGAMHVRKWSLSSWKKLAWNTTIGLQTYSPSHFTTCCYPGKASLGIAIALPWGVCWDIGNHHAFRGQTKCGPDSATQVLQALSCSFALQDQVGSELDRLEQGVLEGTSYSEWAAPVIVLKPDGNLRLCGDFKVTPLK